MNQKFKKIDINTEKSELYSFMKLRREFITDK